MVTAQLTVFSKLNGVQSTDVFFRLREQREEKAAGFGGIKKGFSGFGCAGKLCFRCFFCFSLIKTVTDVIEIQMISVHPAEVCVALGKSLHRCPGHIKAFILICPLRFVACC